MIDIIKRAVISIGIFLGVLHSQVDPVLYSRIFKLGQDIYFTAEIEQAVNKDIEELILSSNKVEITINIICGSTEKYNKSFTHSIFYLPTKKTFSIYYSETDTSHTTVDKKAAFTIFNRFYRIKILNFNEFEGLKNKTIYIKASISMKDSKNFDINLLWNYKKPENIFTLSSLKEIPY